MKGSVGVVFGVSSTARFDFVVTEPSKVHGTDYVKAWHPEGYWVLARVTDVERKNDSQSLDDLSIETSEEVVSASAVTIGSRDERGVLRPPRSPLSPGDRVYPADEELLEGVLGLGEGSLYLGLLENTDIPVRLEAASLVKKHCSILARTGSGKSYAAGVLMEELMESGVPILVIDPHGEYGSLRSPNSRKGERDLMERYGVEPRGYPGVHVFSPTGLEGETFRMNGLNLGPRELKELVPTSLTNTQVGVLYKAIKELREEGLEYDVEDVIERAEDNRSKSKWNLINSLEYLRDLDVLSASPTPVEELVREGRCSVLDMRGVEPEMQPIIVARTARNVFEARKRGEVPPVMMFLEEAHNFVPERGFGKVASSDVLRTVASEGRKFGMGLCVVSQRPAKVDKNVLSQCNTQIILKVTNPNDLKALASGVEGLTADMEDEVSRLPSGSALMVSTNVERPVLVDVRVRRSLHGDGGLDLPDEPQGGSGGGGEGKRVDRGSRGDAGSDGSSREGGGLIGKLFRKRGDR
ncbi:MAG: DNA double-strand break repair helicase HerA [Methanonatronarchaeales archaeon]|nr:DNA double-strand break repair helicase HerA [Methanonatronarchaeales archaeon]